MTASIARILPLALFIAGAALAEVAPAPPKTGPSPTSGSDEGPFPPLPNGEVSLTAVPVAPGDAAKAPAAATAPGPSLSAAQPATNDVKSLEERAARERVVEDQLDRAEREHERARDEATRNAATIEGAFTGLTGERDR